MKIDAIGRLVLTVANVDATGDFYNRLLGMPVATFGEQGKALSFGTPKINLHQRHHEIEPKADKPNPRFDRSVPDY